MKIVRADHKDSARIRDLYLEAFDETERDSVAGLAIALLSGESDCESVHLIAETKGNLVGHVSFSPVWQKGNRKKMGQILAPLAVAPAWQKRGIGSSLVREGLNRFTNQDDKYVFVYGDPDFYRRFGFTHDLAEGFLPPYPLKYPFGWQALGSEACKIPDPPVEIECVAPLCLPELW